MGSLVTEAPSHRLFAAIYDPATRLVERTILRPHREYLVQDLEGRVLDLGAGTGAMFPCFADDGWRRRLQGVLAPLWRTVAGGCHLTRRTPPLFAQVEELDIVELERMSIGVMPVRPFVRGRLVHRQREGVIREPAAIKNTFVKS